jgi:hypothetical protein
LEGPGLSNFTDFKATIRKWIDRQSIPDDVVQGWIRMAELRADRELMVKEGVARDTVTMSSNSVKLPDDWIQTEYLRYAPAAGSANPDIRNGKTLQFRSNEQFWQLQNDVDNSDHLAAIYTIVGDVLYLNPAIAPTDLTVLEIGYYAKVPPLALNTSNWLLDNYSDLFLYATLANSGMYLVEDDRVPLWQTVATDMINKANEAWTRAKNSGSPLRPRFRSFG